MCGIVGFCTRAEVVPAWEEVMAALGPIRHRGPDSDGSWTGPGVALGHVRLSILDLSEHGSQPMVSADGRYVLSFNGEIYNYRELRDELARHGVAVTSTGDTEVLLAQIGRFGVTAALPKLEGDWAVAVWDRADQVMTLARDVHGVKPLYYAETADGGLRFGSEHKALVRLDPREPRPNVAAVNAALLGYSTTWGDRTLYHGIRAVRPGEQLTFDRLRGTVERRTFASVLDWVDDDLYRELRRASTADVVGRVEAAITAGVRSRLLSDAPVACLVSGGVDSSLITCLAAEERPDLPLYHADVVHNSERPAAEALAGSLGLPLHAVRVTDDDLLSFVPEVTWYNDGPLIYHLNALPFYAVCRLAASDGIKVLLTGEGSDEYFIGYPQQALEPVTAFVNRLKAVPRSWLAALSPRAAAQFWPRTEDTFAQRLLELSSGFEDARTTALGAAAASGALSGRDRRSRIVSLRLALSHLVSLLHRNDRLGMAWGLEARFPFLSPELTRLAVNLPDRYKLRRTLRAHDRRHPFIQDKWAIRQVATRRMPDRLSGRPKMGFPVSVGKRLTVVPKFFADGFVADLYALDEPAIELATGDGPSDWLTRLVLLEVWGRLFFRGASIDAVQSHLLACTRTG